MILPPVSTNIPNAPLLDFCIQKKKENVIVQFPIGWSPWIVSTQEAHKGTVWGPGGGAGKGCFRLFWPCLAPLASAHKEQFSETYSRVFPYLSRNR